MSGAPIPRKDQITNLPLDMGEKPVVIDRHGLHLSRPDRLKGILFSQSKESAVEEAARSEIVLLKPNRCQKSDMKDRGSN